MFILQTFEFGVHRFTLIMDNLSDSNREDEFQSQLDVQREEVEEPELPDDLAKELLNTRIRPVFPTKRYRKVVTRNPHNGEWEVTYMPKRKKTWTSQSAAGFKKACEARAEKCKQRKQQRMQDQIAKLKAQLEELKDTTDGLNEEEEEEDSDEEEESDGNYKRPPFPIGVKRKEIEDVPAPTPKKKSKKHH